MSRAPESLPTSLAGAFAEPATAELRDHIRAWAWTAAERPCLIGLAPAPEALVEAGLRLAVLFGESRTPHQARAWRRVNGSDAEEASNRARLAICPIDTDIEITLLVPPGGLKGLRSYLAIPETAHSC